jgi:hypothetical protein
MSDVATGAGLMAASIAVFGFLAHVRPALAGADEQELRRATVGGGIGGAAFSALVIVLSAYTG